MLDGDSDHTTVRATRSEIVSSMGIAVISKCANPVCKARMKYMREGRVFLLHRRSANACSNGADASFSPLVGQHVECFWLCHLCSQTMRITREGDLIVTDALRISEPEVNCPSENLVAA
jgi:hypothetical protein